MRLLCELGIWMNNYVYVKITIFFRKTYVEVTLVTMEMDTNHRKVKNCYMAPNEIIKCMWIVHEYI